MARFIAFYQVTLRKSANETPTGESVEQVSHTLGRRIIPLNGIVPQHGTYKCYLTLLIHGLIFKFVSFKMFSTERRRIKALFNTMLQDGKSVKPILCVPTNFT